MRTLQTTHIQDGGKCIYLKVTIHEHRSDGVLLEGCSSLKEDEKACHGDGSLCPSVRCKKFLNLLSDFVFYHGQMSTAEEVHRK